MSEASIAYGTFRSPAAGDDFVPSGLVGRGHLAVTSPVARPDQRPEGGTVLELRAHRRNVALSQALGCLGFVAVFALTVAGLMAIGFDPDQGLESQPVWFWPVALLPLAALYGVTWLTRRFGERPIRIAVPLSSVKGAAFSADGSEWVIRLSQGAPGVVFFRPLLADDPAARRSADAVRGAMEAHQSARDDRLVALLELVASASL